MLDGLFAHPATDSDTNTPHELISAYDATIEFFRSLLERTGFHPDWLQLCFGSIRHGRLIRRQSHFLQKRFSTRPGSSTSW
ncbi:hypothetical protein NSND_61924 [Nitrospira sp. ND1]|nr:hypothetical protein NSND_61924 [Nitrospira sp. ND1]